MRRHPHGFLFPSAGCARPATGRAALLLTLSLAGAAAGVHAGSLSPPICPAQAVPANDQERQRIECAGPCAYQPPVDVPAQALDEFETYEGRVPYMYLDTRDNVTTGIGDRLPNAGAASVLPFFGGADPAPPPTIEDGFGTVTAQAQPAACADDVTACRGAASYGGVVDLLLHDAAIDAIARGQIASFGDELRTLYAGFDGYPAKVQLALYDMIFNLGQTKLRTGFPSFDAAILAGDWQTAADESHRTGIPEERNAYVKDLLEEAAADASAAAVRLAACPRAGGAAP